MKREGKRGEKCAYSASAEALVKAIRKGTWNGNQFK
jgi:hypothetical protein